MKYLNRWAQLSIQLALSCSSRHFAGRSLQIFRALRQNNKNSGGYSGTPRYKLVTCVNIISQAYYWVTNSLPRYKHVTWVQACYFVTCMLFGYKLVTSLQACYHVTSMFPCYKVPYYKQFSAFQRTYNDRNSLKLYQQLAALQNIFCCRLLYALENVEVNVLCCYTNSYPILYIYLTYKRPCINTTAVYHNLDIHSIFLSVTKFYQIIVNF